MPVTATTTRMTGDPFVDILLRHVAILGFLVIALLLTAMRSRAAALVEAGAVTRREVDRFFQVALVLSLLGAMTLWTLQGRVADPACLLALPPTRGEGTVYWVVVATSAVLFLTWLWARGGADLLYRLIPALTSRARGLDHMTAHGLRIRLTALVVGLPLIVFGLQRLLPRWLEHC